MDERARQAPAALACTWIQDDLTAAETLTWETLRWQVRRLAGYITRFVPPGERALLVYGPGMDSVRAFWACLYAGVIPVPSPSPDATRLKHALPRLQAIARDARASVVLTASALRDTAQGLGLEVEPSPADWVATDVDLDAHGREIGAATAATAGVAYLQYTSGSTSSPRGVIVTHANALHNCAALSASNGADATSRALFWLPYFHDYGLVNGILWPAYVGIPVYLMSPLTFLRRPLRWLEAVSAFGITHTGAPSFAYAACVKAIELTAGWRADLRCLRTANCGAEPINPLVVKRFTETFAAHGFSSRAFAPGYGLAEATLLVTAKRPGAEPTLLHVDANALSDGRVELVDHTETKVRTLVGCGVPYLGMEVAIVDPDTRAQVPPARVGEVWVAGPSVGAGYWGQPEGDTFEQTLCDGPEREWLRTGDLGFLHDGELFITGRRKDLLIFQGRNYYPQDIEWSAERADPRLRKGGCAAFSVDGTEREELVIVQEVERRGIEHADLPLLSQAIRRMVAQDHEIPVGTIVLTRSGSIPKTSSGKIRRASCRAEFLGGRVTALLVDTPEPTAVDPAALALDRAELAALSTSQQRARALQQQLLDSVARLTGRSAEKLSPEASAIECGLDSLACFRLLHEIETALGVHLPPAAVLGPDSIRTLASSILSRLESSDTDRHEDRTTAVIAQDGTSTSEARRLPLSAPQEGVWFVENLAGPSALYNLAQAVRFSGPLHRSALEKSLQALVDRHSALRTTFDEHEGAPYQVVHPGARIELTFTDARQSPMQQREQVLQRRLLDGARRPFDLSRAPLLRAELVRVADEEHVLLLAAHHLVSDGWSMAILADELQALYAADGEAGVLSPLQSDYAGYVRWQRERLALPGMRRHLDYWRSKLHGLQPLDLPTDRPRPVSRSFRGSVERFEVSAELTTALKSLARSEKVTLFMVLLAAFQTLLMRYTGQEDLAVGSPTAGRASNAFHKLVGFFTNTLVLRTDLSGNPTFRQLLERVRATALDAYEHQELPSDRLVAELGMSRDLSRNTLYPAAFALQSLPDTTLRLGDLGGTEIPLHTGTAKSDLWVSLTEAGGALRGELEYSTDLFDAGTMRALAEHYRTLLASIIATPHCRLAELAILTPEERRRILFEWNDTAREYPLDTSVCQLFEQQARHAPDAPAAILGEHVLSYRELDERASRLAHHLRSLGVGQDVAVAVCMERSLELVTALVGILKAGGAFVPIDPDYPPERIELMLADARAPVVLSQHALRERFSAAHADVLCLDTDWPRLVDYPRSWPAGDYTPEQAAYVIYTSGSTGKPKGVVVPHRGLCNHIHWITEALNLTVADRVLQKTSISFDASIWEFFAPLVVGAPVVLAKPGEHRDSERLLRAVRDYGITVMLMVPSALRALLEEPSVEQCVSLRYLLCGGEALDRDLAREILSRLPSVALGNFYGPTEASDDATHHVVLDVPTGPGTVPIGRPIANTRCYVLDKTLQPVPVGVIGELYIGGAGVARGYLNEPELTAKRFIPDPFQSGGRLYRTGDLARYLPNGSIEYAGRADQQVKIHGFRIEPGEIEATLNACPGVAQSAVIVREDDPGRARLVAYVAGAGIDAVELRNRLQVALPEYMVPAAIVLLERLPLLPNEKLDRSALPAPAAGPATTDSLVPRSPIEQALLEIWRDVLRERRIGLQQSFFELGGHSLLATQVISRARETLQVELPLRALFETPTIGGLARRIEHLRREQELVSPPPPIHVLPRSDPLPVTFSQRRMWYIQQLEPRGTAYNMPFALRLKGPLNFDAMTAAVEAIVRRHEAFRTTFSVANGEPVQIIAAHQPVDIQLVDLRQTPLVGRELEAKRLFRDESLRPFDLARGPLFRFVLARLDEEDCAILWLVHHAVADQWSAGIMARDLAAFYGAYARGNEPAPRDLPIQYADFAAWQRQQQSGAALDTQLAYWKQKLRDLPVLALPTDLPRPKQQTFRGSYVQVAIPPEILAALKHLSARYRVTPFMMLLACFKLLLARYSGQEDIAVGVPIANRTHLATEDLIGTLVNTLVMRTRIEGNPTFVELLKRVRETALEAYAHQDLPFERLVEELGGARDGGSSPLVQVLFNVPNAPMDDMKIENLEYDLFEFDHGSAQFDLSISVDTEQFGRVYLFYSTDLFERATAERMLAHYLRLIEQIVVDPGRSLSGYTLLDADERQTLLEDWNRTHASYPEQARTDELIALRARASPGSLAVTMGKQRVTYAELDARANRLARFLRRHGVKRNSPVGICLERSPELVVALLGTMKSGGTYVPLDPAFPHERLQFMAKDAGLAVLITDSALVEVLPELPGRIICIRESAEAIAALPSDPIESDSGPDDLAYLLYTSGSTGKPKGVEIPHRALTNFLWSMRADPGCNADDRVLAVTTLSFDIAGLEIYLPLVTGGQVELASRGESADGRLLKARIRECRPTLMQATPATWRMLIAAGWQGDKRLRVLCGGEALPPDLAAQLLQRCGALWNMYGPTETTIWSTLARIEQTGARAPIGRPIANTEVYVLDRALQPVPIGVAGELYIGGHGLARGYRNLPELTAERFVPHPFADKLDARLYRTGDLVRYAADGQLLHLGRLDFQVKVRGFRVELGEIEARLTQHQAIAQAVLAARSDRERMSQLVAYLKVREGFAQPAVAELRTFVRATLPEYMAPAHFVFLEAFPLTANNKIDVKALPEPVLHPAASAAPVEPHGRLEVQLMALWRRVLENENIGVHDSFFDAGGHSLKAVQLMSYLEQVCGRTLPLATLFQAPTVAQMARLLAQSRWRPSWRSLVAIQPTGKAVPIFAVPGVGGNVLMFALLSRSLGSERPFYGLQARGLDNAQPPFTSVRKMAAHYVEEIRSVRSDGPYIIAGACTGGVVAYEMAQQLLAAGAKVTLILMESWHPSSARSPLLAGALLSPLWRLWSQVTRRYSWDRVSRATWYAIARYRPRALPGRLMHVIAANRPLQPSTVDTRRMWEALASGDSEAHFIAARDSGQLLVEEHVAELADLVRTYIERDCS